VNRGQFATELCAKYHPDRQEWEVLSDLIYQRGNGDIIIVPRGIFSDLASSRNAPLFPSDGPYNREAVLHDFLYQGQFFPRRMADDIMREAMECNPCVPKAKIPVMYRTVRLFGYFHWNKKKVVRARILSNISDTKTCPLWRDGIARFV
jgi:hypothetical protein